MKIKRFEAEDIAMALEHELRTRRNREQERSRTLIGPYGSTWELWKVLFDRRDVAALATHEASDEFHSALLHCIQVLTDNPEWPDRDEVLRKYQERLLKAQPPAAPSEAEDVAVPAAQPTLSASPVAAPLHPPESSPESETSATGDKLTWQEQARAIADELDAIDAKARAWSGVKDMADRVAEEMMSRGIKGPRGPLTGQSVMRGAIQGGRWKRKR